MPQEEKLQILWNSVLGELEVDLGKNTFALYFKNSQLLSLENGIVKLGFRNKAVGAQVSARYYTLIQAALQKHTKTEKISLIFEELHRSSEEKQSEEIGPLFETPKPDKAATAAAIKHVGLRSDYVLEEFCVSTSNQLAFAAAQAVIQNPGKNYNPLFLWGGVGVGKTHLMQGVGHELLRRNPYAKVVYASAETFTNEIIAGIRRQNTADFKEKYRSAEALLIDDIQFLSGKDTAQEEFFHTFNTIQQREGQIIMTSDRKPVDIKGLADRLRSRFEGGLVTDISTPDSELKTAICLLKARKRGIELSTNIASYIASNVENIRSLDGAVQLVISKAASLNEEITPKFVSETLKFPPLDTSAPSPKLDARQVLDNICTYYSIPMKLIKGTQRDRFIARPRQILMYLLKKHTPMTLDEIASFLGRRDHTTVMHGVKNIESLLVTNPQTKNDVDKIEQNL